VVWDWGCNGAGGVAIGGEFLDLIFFFIGITGDFISLWVMVYGNS
jgi:hypothetical protein